MASRTNMGGAVNLEQNLTQTARSVDCIYLDKNARSCYESYLFMEKRLKPFEKKLNEDMRAIKTELLDLYLLGANIHEERSLLLEEIKVIISDIKRAEQENPLRVLDLEAPFKKNTSRYDNLTSILIKTNKRIKELHGYTEEYLFEKGKKHYEN